MSHFLAIAALAPGMVAGTGGGFLITLGGRTPRSSLAVYPALIGAVDVAPVAAAADEHLRPAPGAKK